MSEGLLADVVQALHLAVVERLPNGAFHLVAPAPPWLEGAFDEAPAGAQGSITGALPFVDHFLDQAETAWYQGAPAVAESGPFAARVGGEDLLLRATALTVQQRRLMILEQLKGDADTRPILQRAREHRLDHESLVRKVETLHAPAASIASAIEALSGAALTPDEQRAADRISQASRQLQAAMATLPTPPATRRTR